MPLPSDEKLIALSNDLIAQFNAIFGQYPGFRPAHAKGVMVKGTFTPTAEAATLSKAPHFARPLPVVVRFSNSTGLPLIPDNDPNANPRGMAVRFYMAERVHTDIVSHSTDGFPTHTGAEFLEFLKALASSDPKNLAGSPLEAFLGAHPEALAFVQTPKPAPSSYARETYFGVTAMKFTNAEGVSRFGRYRILPEAGNDFLEGDDLAAKPADYLVGEIVERVGKEPVKFRLAVQLAEEGDVVDNATVHWPDSRTVLTLGTIELTAPVEDSAAEQQHIIFDPIPRVEGIDPSDDPLLELRAAIYLISGRRRRAAENK
ncbi:MAG: catalase family peroxidase [Edaphobacter sp.]|uniref:catalase family peroxidase n=1 Tax=Edaphobacter sp. TaxID=1934404 RepID=UPI00238ED7B2|nr:catalase family peroxidase [Edaphobacter sp.]MDE1177601.1 catalase family peroxidase [Edaphobacter sp.]